MKGNVTFDQVNLVSRITGEGVGRSFEGRGGLVLIKSILYHFVRPRTLEFFTRVDVRKQWLPRPCEFSLHMGPFHLFLVRHFPYCAFLGEKAWYSPDEF